MSTKNKQTKAILLYRMEKTRTLTNTIPDNERVRNLVINYRSSNKSKYKFFELLFP